MQSSMVSKGAHPRKLQPSKSLATAVALEIAAELKECEVRPLNVLRHIVQTLGEDLARSLVTRARAIAAEGGMLTKDGARRRTLGGIYFVLARARVHAKFLAGEWISEAAMRRVLRWVTERRAKPRPAQTPSVRELSVVPKASKSIKRSERRVIEIVTLRKRKKTETP